eukprot:Lankesteria_metandrocarpae@DN5462_c1_g4_i1.p1
MAFNAIPNTVANANSVRCVKRKLCAEPDVDDVFLDTPHTTTKRNRSRSSFSHDSQNSADFIIIDDSNSDHEEIFDLTGDVDDTSWWDNEGKEYSERIPGDHPKELSNGCVNDVADSNNLCIGGEEKPVYTCEGSSTFNVCLQNGEIYYTVRYIGCGDGCQKYYTSEFGIEGARALAYLAAEYRAHPDVTQQRLDREVLSKGVRANGVTVINAGVLVMMRENASIRLYFTSSAFGNARAEILASFAAVLYSKVVLSAIPAQESELRSPDPTQVAKDAVIRRFLHGLFPNEESNTTFERLLKKVEDFHSTLSSGVCTFGEKEMIYDCGYGKVRRDRVEGEYVYRVTTTNFEGRSSFRSFKTKDYGDYGAAILACLTAEHTAFHKLEVEDLKEDHTYKRRSKVFQVRAQGIRTCFFYDIYGDDGAKKLQLAAQALCVHDVPNSRRLRTLV